MTEIDHYGDGVWYDAEYVHIRGDVAYYQDVAASAGGSVLELACGTGRLTIPMAEAGARVHGIDRARAMIERAQEKRIALSPADQERLSFEVADMRTFRSDHRFAAIVLGFNSLMHMTDDADLLATLRTARAHLAPQGRFHFDLHTPFPELPPPRDPDGRYDPQQKIDPRTGARYIVSENNEYDPRRQINHMRFYYRRLDEHGVPIGPERYAALALRVLFPRELDAFLEREGLVIDGEWDDFERATPFSGRGGRRVVVARAA